MVEFCLYLDRRKNPENCEVSWFKKYHAGQLTNGRLSARLNSVSKMNPVANNSYLSRQEGEDKITSDRGKRIQSDSCLRRMK